MGLVLNSVTFLCPRVCRSSVAGWHRAESQRSRLLARCLIPQTLHLLTVTALGSLQLGRLKWDGMRLMGKQPMCVSYWRLLLACSLGQFFFGQDTRHTRLPTPLHACSTMRSILLVVVMGGILAQSRLDSPTLGSPVRAL